MDNSNQNTSINLNKNEESVNNMEMIEHEESRDINNSDTKLEKTWDDYQQKLCFKCPQPYYDNFLIWCCVCFCCCGCFLCFCCEFILNTLLKACNCDPICFYPEFCFLCWADCREAGKDTACCVAFEGCCIGCICFTELGEFCIECGSCCGKIDCDSILDAVGSCCEGCCEIFVGCLEICGACASILG